MGPRDGVGLSGIRDFRLLWISGLLASLGSQMSAIALPLLVLHRTGSPVEAGAVGSVSIGAVLIAMLPGGALADTVERRRLMRICDLGSTLVVGTLAVCVFLGRTPMLLVLPVAAVGAVMNTVYGPAALGLLRAMVPAELLGRATSRLQARGAATRLVGPIGGGALYALHPALPFAAEAVGLLLSTGCLTLVRTRSAPNRGTRSAFSRKEFAAGVGFILGRPYLRTVLLVFGLGLNAAFSAMMFVALATASHGGSSGIGGGTIVSLIAVGSLTGSLLAGKVPAELRPGTMIAATCWACTGTALLLPISQSPLYVGALCSLTIATASMGSVGFATSVLVATPEHLVGRVQSAAGFVSSLIQPLGPLAGGALLTVWGADTAYLVLGGVFLVCAALVSWAPSVRSEPAPVTTERAPAHREPVNP
ncbi:MULTISPECIES: MFS transporter [Streptacidiphilus]|uniref:MFS transporter n=2 Tax=Streptacidiphilus TaxID=228398 RepID=A0ABV6UID7_9ACTN|nr:MFS transporter [Streptacidiphilus jeojiense]